MYKLIGVLTLLQREVAETKEKAEQMTLDGYSYEETDRMVDDFHDTLCDYMQLILESYPGDEAGE